MSKHRTLIEDEVFTAQLADIAGNVGNIRYLDDALLALTWALSTNPEEYEVIPGTKGLRVAKTRWYERESIIVPVLKVWFSIVDDDHVLLRAMTVEEYLDEENY
jgi:hypothetical protein